MINRCVFKLIADKQWRCQLCGQIVRTQGNKPPKAKCEELIFDCRFRGEVIRQEICNTCWNRGQPINISACAKHGECVKRQHQTPARIKDCLRCEDRKPSTFPRVEQPQCNVIAVTSLAPNDKARDALESWRLAGVSIVAMQPRDELAKVQKIYGGLVDEWRATDQDARWTFGRPCVFIHDLAKLAIEFNQTIMLLNSDIEIHGGQQRLIDATDADALTIGIRHNFHDWRDATIEAHGLDVFFISPPFARNLPDTGLAMGFPGWDYWLPKHATMTNTAIEWIEEPLFFHRRHELNWSHADWQKSFTILQAAGYDFGLPEGFTIPEGYAIGAKFRESLRRVTV